MIRSRIIERSTLADRLKSAREGTRLGGRKLSQLGLAQAVRVSRNTVSRWENGEMIPRDPAVLASLAEVLEVSVDWLISGDQAAATTGELHDGGGRRYLDPATAELPDAARSLAMGYLDRLYACGCSQTQRRGAETLLLAGARNTVSSTPFEERADADVSADVDAAWDVVLRILRREGIRP